jgi:hypothetical protein
MFIFVDESGTFTHSIDQDSWCIVAAYVIPEYLRRKVDALMNDVRRRANKGAETKLKHLSDEEYGWFLSELKKIGGLAFAVATDVSLHRRSEIENHKNAQVAKIIEHRDKLMHEKARQDLTEISVELKNLPMQLYVQLICQIHLFHQIITLATLYFVQRHPQALGSFRWRLDQKSKEPTAYEDNFRKILPVMLQTLSLTEPMIVLKDENYSYFEHFMYPKGLEPTYLRDLYGIQMRGGSATNIGKIVTEDFHLLNSEKSAGIQVADLLSSGLRRLLRGGFSNSDILAKNIGGNMVQDIRRKIPVILVSLDKTGFVSDGVAHILRIISASARPLLVK